MAFNKVFVILLAFVTCGTTMPVHPVDHTVNPTEVETTSLSNHVKIEESTTVQEATTTVQAFTDEEAEAEATGAVSTPKNIANEELVDDDIVKRSVQEESSDADAEDMETAAGTNVLRPLFVYRQQVAYRQRVKNANRRGNRRF